MIALHWGFVQFPIAVLYILSNVTLNLHAKPLRGNGSYLRKFIGT